MIGDDFWEYCLGVNNLDGISFEEWQLMYRTRFFIWANYDIPGASDLTLSTNYLSSYVLSLTSLQMTNYQKYLLQQRKLIPAMNAYGYLGTDGTMHEWGSTDAGAAETARLDDYNNLICNELTGGKNRDTTFYLP